MSELPDEKGSAPSSSPKKSLLPEDVSLDQLIHDPSSKIMTAVAADPRLTEDLALALLKRRDLPREALETLHKHKSLAKLRKVQLAIVMHPHTPRHVSVPTIRHLYAFELMQVALIPAVVPDVRRAAEEALIARLATISSGERFELAKRSSARVAAALLTDKEERTVQAALANPQMTEIGIVKSLKSSTGTELLAPAVCRHQKWSQRIEVKLALIANPHTPSAFVTRFAAEVPLRTLKELLNSGRLAPGTKDCLKAAIAKRAGA